MKKRHLLLIGTILVTVVGIVYINKTLFGFNIIDDFILTNGKSCGFAWKDYGECEKGYYCKSSFIFDAPGSCIKVVRWKDYILYEGDSIHYLGNDLTISIIENKPLAEFVEWRVVIQKGNVFQEEVIRLKGFEKKELYALGHSVRFRWLDRRWLKVALLH